MRPRRTIHSNKVFRLAGGNEDNDLWVEADTDYDENPIVKSVWVFTDAERHAIAKGYNVELVVWGGGHPPVALHIVDKTLGKAP
jgi:hypothetical protein